MSGLDGYPLGRPRAGVVVLVDGRLALIDRVRPGSPPYSTIPGGGIERGESFEDAAVREAKEELGLDVELRSSQPAWVLQMGDHEQHYFLADAIAGTFGTGTGNELVSPRPGRGTYTPVLVTPDEAARRELAPFALSEALLRAFVTGEWPDVTVELTDPRHTPPWRVRAGAICLDDRDHVALIRGEWERGPFFELAGGGVEEGETPEQAVVREVEEEVGVHVRIERKLAEVWKNGREEHYFLVRPDGRSSRTTLDLDLDPGFVQEWHPVSAIGELPVWPKRLAWRVAEWHAEGRWPEHPVRLIDTIQDLNPPCRW